MVITARRENPCPKQCRVDIEELDLIANTKSSLPKMLLSGNLLANEISYRYSLATRYKYKANVVK